MTSYNEGCPEQVRRLMLEPELDYETDAAAVGTAVHAGIEVAIGEWQRSGEHLEVDWMINSALLQWESSIQDGLVWVKYDEKQAERLVVEACKKWHGEIYPTIKPAHTELTFKGIKLYEDDEREILLNGTIDYVDAKGWIGDWKTAGRKYEAWEKERWNIQSTTYLFAADQLGLLPERDGWNFVFIVMIHGKPEIQRVRVRRTRAHFDWLRQQALQFAQQIEQGLDRTWQLRDSGWWCGPRWCPVWDNCKGAHVEIDAGKVGA